MEKGKRKKGSLGFKNWGLVLISCLQGATLVDPAPGKPQEWGVIDHRFLLPAHSLENLT
jgi:hypothetical protein